MERPSRHASLFAMYKKGSTNPRKFVGESMRHHLCFAMLHCQLQSLFFDDHPIIVIGDLSNICMIFIDYYCDIYSRYVSAKFYSNVVQCFDCIVLIIVFCCFLPIFLAPISYRNVTTWFPEWLSNQVPKTANGMHVYIYIHIYMYIYIYL